MVTAQFPGANPSTIAETVATPLEEQINGVENMLYMSSQAACDGTLTLTVTFKLGTDPNLAQQLVQNRVNQALPRLPEVTRNLGVTTVKSSPDLTMVVHLLSPDGRYDMLYLRNYAVLNVKDQLAKIEGVGSVQLFGSGDYAMRIWLNPEKIAERGMTAGRCGRRHPPAECPGRGRRHQRPALWHQSGELQLPINVEGPAQRSGAVRARSSSSATAAWSRGWAMWRGSRSTPRNTACARCSTTSRRWPFRSSRRPAPTPSRSPTTCAPPWRS